MIEKNKIQNAEFRMQNSKCRIDVESNYRVSSKEWYCRRWPLDQQQGFYYYLLNGIRLKKAPSGRLLPPVWSDDQQQIKLE